MHEAQLLHKLLQESSAIGHIKREEALLTCVTYEEVHEERLLGNSQIQKDFLHTLKKDASSPYAFNDYR